MPTIAYALCIGFIGTVVISELIQTANCSSICTQYVFSFFTMYYMMHIWRCFNCAIVVPWSPSNDCETLQYWREGPSHGTLGGVWVNHWEGQGCSLPCLQLQKRTYSVWCLQIAMKSPLSPSSAPSSSPSSSVWQCQVSHSCWQLLLFLIARCCFASGCALCHEGFFRESKLLPTIAFPSSSLFNFKEILLASEFYQQWLW